jgi:hypothetical protein
MKTRTFPEHNYRGVYMNGKTIRIALDPSRPIGELAYPEFWDVKVTSRCGGACQYCYQSSNASAPHATGIVERFKRFFGRFNENEKPFQIAFGGGEPTCHPEFVALLRACSELGIVPNYTTNGMWSFGPERAEIVRATSEYCGGVAVSTHPHLELEWRNAVEDLLALGMHTNLHVIIGDRASVDRFSEIYREYSGRVKYFVLLPLAAQGRSVSRFDSWRYLSDSIDGSPHDIAFGAMFHPYLAAEPGRFRVSIYEPESMSAYLDLETMQVFKSSFSSEPRTIGNAV